LTVARTDGLTIDQIAANHKQRMADVYAAYDAEAANALEGVVMMSITLTRRTFVMTTFSRQAEERALHRPVAPH
jgi:hypothetical protein